MTPRDATPGDAPAICTIYNHYVAHTVITFEESEVSVGDMTSRIEAATLSLPWLVVEEGCSVVGYAYAGKFAARAAYRYAVESTVYVHKDAGRHGLGRVLYDALLARLRAQGHHTVLGFVALPNPASVALHERCGFKKVAHLTEVGFKFGRWIDVGYWQCLLNR